MQVSAVPTEFVLDIWPEVEGYMDDVCVHTHGRYEASDILSELLRGASHLWIAFEGGESQRVVGAVVTSFINYPRAKYLNCPFVTGDDFPSWKAPMLALLQRFARDNDCEGLESTARLGWARVFRDDGYKALWQTFQLPAGEE